jgi:hypothetical protein
MMCLTPPAEIDKIFGQKYNRHMSYPYVPCVNWLMHKFISLKNWISIVYSSNFFNKIHDVWLWFASNTLRWMVGQESVLCDQSTYVIVREISLSYACQLK